MNKVYSFIEWDARLILGIPLIDKQHEKLVQLTNNLHLACLQSTETASAGFMAAVREAVNYVQQHFTTEEKMMLLFDFPEFTAHKGKHEGFVIEFLTQTQKFINRRHLAPNRFVYFLKDWILSHIAVNDKVFAEFVLQTRQHEKLEQLFPKSA